MTTSRPGLDPHRRLTTDDDLHELILGLLERAGQRQLWAIFLDDDQRLTGPLVPIEDLPHDPAEPSSAPGFNTSAEVLFDRLGSIGEVVDSETLVLVWERRGPSLVFTGDHAWAKAMGEEARRHGPTVRAQFILHDSGLRHLTPDDLV